MILRKKKNDEKLDIAGINTTISLTKNILKIFTVLLCIVGVYVSIIILKELHVKQTVVTVLKILLPFFIGLFIAWLFDPVVTKLQDKGVRRSLGAALVYVLFIGILFLILKALIPLLLNQINDFVKIIPTVFDNIKSWADEIFERFDGFKKADIQTFKSNLFANIENFSTELTKSLPEITINLLRTIFSGIGNFLVGLIIGFFLLINFNNVSDSIITLFPKKLQKDTKDIFDIINVSFRRFINGAIADSTLVFIVSSTAFIFAGLKAPLLFGLFCGITNVIPYVGPYIGGTPAVIVAFSQSTRIGLIVLIAIVIIQALEGNLIQPLIMSKSTRLHPVTVIIGLLVFGHFFGIIGMVISTPVIGACKALFQLFDKKYNILNYNKE